MSNMLQVWVSDAYDTLASELRRFFSSNVDGGAA